MSGRVKVVLQALLTLLAVAAIGGALWWATQVPAPPSDVGVRATPSPSSTADVSAGAALSTDGDAPATVPPTATPASTATPAPTPSPTPLPEPVPFLELIGRPDLVEEAETPLPDCGLFAAAAEVVSIGAGTVGLSCVEEWSSVEVFPIAAGRIVGIVREAAQPIANDVTVADVGRWSWSHQLALGPHIVVDHGPFAGSRNMQTVYAGLETIPDDLVIGLSVDPTLTIGSLAGPRPVLGFSLWDGNVRQDGAEVVEAGPDADTQRTAAAALGPIIATPTDPRCPLSIAGGQLPGAPRGYRNGTHQGIDFGCGTAERLGHAIADGRVVYLVDDYQDPSVADREALLRNAGIAGFTPHWTLVMLYGNVVVIDHGEIPGAGRVYSIAAHLEQVDPAIELGASVTKGQVLGELGNRGTNASAQGIRGSADPSLHLHWELFIDNWYLGEGQPANVVGELVETALCDAAETPGCPAR